MGEGRQGPESQGKGVGVRDLKGWSNWSKVLIGRKNSNEEVYTANEKFLVLGDWLKVFRTGWTERTTHMALSISAHTLLIGSLSVFTRDTAAMRLFRVYNVY